MDPMQTVICTVAECSEVCAWLSLQSPFPGAGKSTSVDLSKDVCRLMTAEARIIELIGHSHDGQIFDGHGHVNDNRSQS